MTSVALVPDVLARRAESDADLPFVTIGDQARTYAQMHERAERVAAGLSSLGVRRGDRVATILPNCMEHVDVIFACARLGAIHVPVNVFLKAQFLSYQLSDAGASVVIADRAGLDAVETVRPGLPDLVHVVESESLPESDDSPPVVELRAGDTMAVVYTSGTTGMPKGCMLPYGYHTSTDNSLLEYGAGDVLYTALPLFHGWARGMLFGGALAHGLSFHIDAEFSAARILRRLAETRATVLSGVGAMGMAMLSLPPSDADRAHELRLAFMIPFAQDAEAAFTSRFGPRVQSQMYGQTETGAITFTPLREPGSPGSVGRASPQYDVRVVDDDDRDADAGEVIVRPKRSDTMYTGYWRKPDDTAEAMRGGWHHTGDLARFDDHGFMLFVDRKKDAVRRRGENVSSVQLEAAVVSHPKIVEAAVVGVPSEMTEDDIKVCIVATQALTPAELFEFFRDRLPYFAIPRYVEIVEALPKTATARVQKHVLREAGVTPATWDLEQLGLVVDRDERRR